MKNPTGNEPRCPPAISVAGLLLSSATRKAPSACSTSFRRTCQPDLASATCSGALCQRLFLRHFLLQLLGRQPNDVLVLVAVDVVLLNVEVLEHDLARQHLALPVG